MTENTALRQCVIGILAHVDHGKTKLLDKIRGSAVQIGEAGGITQAIGASIIPLETIKKICGSLLGEKTKFSLPGLLFIDTPGHAAFTTLRKRGGSIADIAILVIDINEGFKPQTFESIEILKSLKTPFIVAANKIDLIPGYKQIHKNLLQNIQNQDPFVQERIDTKIYEILGKLSELGFESERFDRIEDYTKQVAIVPTSAITGDGIPELLMVLIGLAQKYLEQSLRLHVKGNAKGTVLEVKESTGLGTTLDVIIYDGILKTGDKIIIGSLEKPIETRVKALLCPLPLKEMRDKKTKFKGVKQVTAATGVKISAPEIDNVIAGMPLQNYNDENKTQIIEEIQKEVQEVLIETNKEGIIIKADTLGSLEALTFLLKEKNISVRKATIGNITKKDITEAEASYEKDPLKAVILGFNVGRDQDVSSTDKVKIITNNIIYKILEEFEQWQEQTRKILEAKELDLLVRPCKVQLLSQYVFRQNNPAIIGAEILEGKIKVSTRLMIKNKPVATLKSIQEEKENLSSVTKGKQAAFALEGVTLGRQLKGDEILYSFIPEDDFRKIKKLTKYLSHGEIQVLKEIASFMREDNPVWGI
ncbi:translation initiation factor IF-2 [Candidatus Woesearchaeota archaeon]|nr:translation initiation factor IF-2 [Candidatus Woesearchaeota archaeon]